MFEGAVVVRAVKLCSLAYAGFELLRGSDSGLGFANGIGPLVLDEAARVQRRLALQPDVSNLFAYLTDRLLLQLSDPFS